MVWLFGKGDEIDRIETHGEDPNMELNVALEKNGELVQKILGFSSIVMIWL